MVGCERVRELLSASLDGELPPEVVAAVDAHVVGCHSCGEEQRRLAQVRSLVRTLPTRRMPAPVRDDLHAAAAAREAGSRPRRALVIAALALATSLGGVLGVVTRSEPGEPVPLDTLINEHLAISGPWASPADSKR